MPTMQVRSLKDIAAEIRNDWKPRIAGAAEPYVNAMSELHGVGDSYYADSAVAVISYFWRMREAGEGLLRSE
jgi:hypothetical protein